MTNKISRRDWLKGTTAIAGGLMLGAKASAQSLTVEGYTPTAENPIRMSSNENPYGVNRAARTAMNNSYDVAHLYGGSGRRELTELLTSREGVAPENMLITAGSSEILHTMALLTGIEGGKLLAPDPTFDNNFLKYAVKMGVEQIRVPVADDMSIDLDAMRAAMTDDVKIIYIVNPNNPTPTVIHAEELKKFCIEMSKKCYVFIDEAYYEYVTDPNYETMIPLAVEHDNIIVTSVAELRKNEGV